ncbi:hypothetical protein BD626DRAFT_584658 [Schizophyllum amplum]|uniref:Uncharacterized protein n=1 Tax=Schizophyllum amplum TaxID=97359 RepID=A0A550C941_9AGAR|nr:hypothetical protein BD626DRAFT_584658 [Auriculariopsis ampla]
MAGDNDGGPSGKPLNAHHTPSRPPVQPRETFKGTPTVNTPNRRSPNIRQKVIATIGKSICLITCMFTAWWLLHCMHLVPRKLHSTHPKIFSRLRKTIGIKKGKGRYLNLDATGNQDIVHADLHYIYDGIAYWLLGSGDWAYKPVDIVKSMAELEQFIIEGKDWKEMYPDDDIAYEYIMYGFPNDHDHVFGRYSDDIRDYAHLRDKSTPVEVAEDPAEDEDDVPTGEYNPRIVDADLPDDFPRMPQSLENKPSTVTCHILKQGDQGFRLHSHAKPVFAIFGYAAKMWYRLVDHPDTMAAGIPEADVIEFWDHVYPTAKRWFLDQPGEEPCDAGGLLTRSKTRNTQPTDAPATTREQDVETADPVVSPESLKPVSSSSTQDARDVASVAHALADLSDDEELRSFDLDVPGSDDITVPEQPPKSGLDTLNPALEASTPDATAGTASNFAAFGKLAPSATATDESTDRHAQARGVGVMTAPNEDVPTMQQSTWKHPPATSLPANLELQAPGSLPKVAREPTRKQPKRKASFASRKELAAAAAPDVPSAPTRQGARELRPRRQKSQVVVGASSTVNDPGLSTANDPGPSTKPPPKNARRTATDRTDDETDDADGKSSRPRTKKQRTKKKQVPEDDSADDMPPPAAPPKKGDKGKGKGKGK